MTTKPSINLHIERLTIDASLIPQAGGPIAGAALTEELTRVINDNGIGSEVRPWTSVPTIDAGAVRAEGGSSPRELGIRIARQLYEGLSR